MSNLGIIRVFGRKILQNSSFFPLQSVRNMAQKGLEAVPDVNIDPAGRFKYILIDVKAKSGGNKFIVRGYARCPFHADIMDETEVELMKADCRGNCVGGGRIEHDPQEKKIKVYGYSQGYGKADHEKSVEILKKRFADYDITWSDEGY